VPGVLGAARGLIVILWRAGLRIHEALAARRGLISISAAAPCSCGAAGLETRMELPVGPLFYVLTGPTRGRP
jgi:hypothetical protein